mmetsp:Transcript_18603/g.38901  ORF Transcript_18603/g.38901 Transcript_18603/m.38901 type:complete len:171 (-) Transcript_18603:507-1019(-)
MHCLPACVGNVRNGFGGDAEKLRGVHVAHREGEVEPNKWLGIKKNWRDHESEAWYVLVSHPDAHVRVAHVNLHHKNRAEVWVGRCYFVGEAAEGATKLDCFRWRLTMDSIVEAVKGEVIYQAMTPTGLSQRLGKFLMRRRGRTSTCPKRICSASLVRTKAAHLVVELWQL